MILDLNTFIEIISLLYLSFSYHLFYIEGVNIKSEITPENVTVSQPWVTPV